MSVTPSPGPLCTSWRETSPLRSVIERRERCTTLVHKRARHHAPSFIDDNAYHPAI